MNVMSQTMHMTRRHIMQLLRQPVWIFVTLVQPVIWLLLFGELFQQVTNIPGFSTGSYITFLTPGIVVMSAMFSAGWSGMSLMDDMDRGVIDRMLVTPAVRVSLVLGRLLQGSIVIVVQSLIIVGLAKLRGASFAGIDSVIVLVAISVVLGLAFGAVSDAIALRTRREETLVAVLNFMLLPLTFLSSAFMQRDLMPGWMRAISTFNPVEWAVVSGRDIALGSEDAARVVVQCALLTLLAVIATTWTVASFRSYQRSL